MDEQKRRALIRRLANERRQTLLAAEKRRLAEIKRLRGERKIFEEQQRLVELERLDKERRNLESRLAEERRIAELRRLLEEDRRLELLLFQLQNQNRNKRTPMLQPLESTEPRNARQ